MNKENQDNGIKLTTDEALKLIKELKERVMEASLQFPK